MNLIIVESPTKARTLERFLGKDFSVEATIGHIKDLPKSKLGVDVENDFAPEYVLLAKKGESVKKIKEAAKTAKSIYLATDPDREGEAIAKHIHEILSEKDTKILSAKKRKNRLISRIVFHEITKEAVEEALKNPRGIDKNLVDAQTARRVLDRLVGYKLSPLLWRKVRRGLSAGRVQTVTVRLIVEREREIEAFDSEEYWEIYCNVKCQMSNVKCEPFVVKLIKIGDEKAGIKNKREADKVVSDLEKANYRVLDVDKKEVFKNPVPPFTTSTMTQTAARLFFWPAKKTMVVAQGLYEDGLITYHRTDSTNIAGQALTRVRDFIKKEFGERYLPEKPRFYKTASKVAQEAHEAVRPTDVNSKFKTQNSKFARDGEKLYNLIWKRFVACQMAAAVYDQTTIDVQAQVTSNKSQVTSYVLRASGQVMKFDGWKTVYGMTNDKLSTSAKASADRQITNGDAKLPDVEEGKELQLIKVIPEQKFTEPPPRFTEATIIKTLEKLGIGRPSTYAPIITTIQLRQYVEKKEGKFYPTPVGISVNDFLITNFPDVFEYKFTAEMEADLDKIANGEVEWVKTIKTFWGPFDKKLVNVTENSKRVKIEVEKTGRSCPECKVGELVIRIGRFGKFISCSRFPECKHTEKYVEKAGMKCPECGKGDVIIKTTKRGKRFYGCSRYPDCKWASWRKPQDTPTSGS